MSRRARLIRLIVMPLVVLAVALALGVWESRQRSAAVADVERWVGALLRDVAVEGERATGLAACDPMLRRRLGPVLVELVGEGGSLEIAVTPGDSPSAGPNPPQAATHVATIRLGSTDRLALRLVHDGSGPTELVGYFLPQAG